MDTNKDSKTSFGFNCSNSFLNSFFNLKGSSNSSRAVIFLLAAALLAFFLLGNFAYGLELNFSASSGYSLVPVCQGSTFKDVINIENIGDIPLKLSIYPNKQMESSAWITVVPDSIELKPGEEKSVISFITPNFKAEGSYKSAIVINSSFGLSKAIEQTIYVGKCPNVDISIANYSFTNCPCSPTLYVFDIGNTGDYTETYDLSMGIPESYYTLSDSVMAVAAHSKRKVFAYVKMPCSYTGDYYIDFIAKARHSGYIAKTLVFLSLRESCYSYDAKLSNATTIGINSTASDIFSDSSLSFYDKSSTKLSLCSGVPYASVLALNNTGENNNSFDVYFSSIKADNLTLKLGNSLTSLYDSYNISLAKNTSGKLILYYYAERPGKASFDVSAFAEKGEALKAIHVDAEFRDCNAGALQNFYYLNKALFFIALFFILILIIFLVLLIAMAIKRKRGAEKQQEDSAKAADYGKDETAKDGSAALSSEDMDSEVFTKIRESYKKEEAMLSLKSQTEEESLEVADSIGSDDAYSSRCSMKKILAFFVSAVLLFCCFAFAYYLIANSKVPAVSKAYSYLGQNYPYLASIALKAFGFVSAYKAYFVAGFFSGLAVFLLLVILGCRKKSLEEDPWLKSYKEDDERKALDEVKKEESTKKSHRAEESIAVKKASEKKAQKRPVSDKKKDKELSTKTKEKGDSIGFAHFFFVVLFCALFIAATFFFFSGYFETFKQKQNSSLIQENSTNYILYSGKARNIDLSEFIRDTDMDNLSIYVTPVSNINVAITGTIVSFTPESNFTGTRYVTFIADDGKGGRAYSPDITLVVLKPKSIRQLVYEFALSYSYQIILFFLLLIIAAIFFILFIKKKPVRKIVLKS